MAAVPLRRRTMCHCPARSAAPTAPARAETRCAYRPATWALSAPAGVVAPVEGVVVAVGDPTTSLPPRCAADHPRPAVTATTAPAVATAAATTAVRRRTAR